MFRFRSTTPIGGQQFRPLTDACQGKRIDSQNPETWRENPRFLFDT